MTRTSLYALAVPSGTLTPAERAADSRNSYRAACEAMRHRHDLPDVSALPDPGPALPARAVNVPLTVTVENERHGFGRLWFDGADWHPRLVLGRQPPRMGPVKLVILAKLPPATPDAGLADAAAGACRGLALADLRQVQRAVLCREAADAPSVEIDLRPAAAMRTTARRTGLAGGSGGDRGRP